MSVLSKEDCAFILNCIEHSTRQGGFDGSGALNFSVRAVEVAKKVQELAKEETPAPPAE